MHHETVARRLRDVEPCARDGKSEYYRLADALPAIYAGLDEQSKALAQRTRYDAARAAKIEHEVRRLRAQLVPAGQVETQWERMREIAQKALLAIIAQAAPKALLCTTFAQVRELLDAEVRRALAQLGSPATAKRVLRSRS
ncbi:MAG TPA: hypothetical protein VF203_07745 [Burkholderiales bacterium]